MTKTTLLAYEEEGQGRPLLLIHGWMMQGRMFEPLRPLLTMRYRLIVPDLRGQGGSRNLPPPYSPEQYATDLIKLLDHMGIQQTDVLGYSQGGIVAQELVHQAPERVERLILACTFAHNIQTPREWVEAWLLAWLIRLLGAERLVAMTLRNSTELTPAQVADLQAMVAANDQATVIASYREMMRFDSRPWLAEIECPTLIVAGAQDTTVPIHHARQLHSLIPGSDLQVIQGAGHGLLQTHTEALAAAIG
jgi:3-oxoadipate enol-lactonase